MNLILIGTIKNKNSEIKHAVIVNYEKNDYTVRCLCNCLSIDNYSHSEDFKNHFISDISLFDTVDVEDITCKHCRNILKHSASYGNKQVYNLTYSVTNVIDGIVFGKIPIYDTEYIGQIKQLITFSKNFVEVQKNERPCCFKGKDGLCKHPFQKKDTDCTCWWKTCKNIYIRNNFLSSENKDEIIGEPMNKKYDACNDCFYNLVGFDCSGCTEENGFINYLPQSEFTKEELEKAKKEKDKTTEELSNSLVKLPLGIERVITYTHSDIPDMRWNNLNAAVQQIKSEKLIRLFRELSNVDYVEETIKYMAVKSAIANIVKSLINNPKECLNELKTILECVGN